MKLSVCLAVFNEEKNIHYALDSAYDIADEVIIVDGGSTDKTVEIAQSYGSKVRIIPSDNPAMFHINKQKAIEAAQGEWILQLDADEAVSSELKEEIKRMIQRHSRVGGNPDVSGSRVVARDNSDNIAYWIPRKNWFLTRFLTKGGQYPDYTIRLYRNGAVKFPCKDVHENVVIINHKSQMTNDKSMINDKCINDQIGYLKNPILHYADADFSRYLKRWDRYTTLEAVLQEGKSQKSKVKSIWTFFEYFVWKPIITFLSMYFRHKGFMDGFAGFVFALFSSIRFWAIYTKWRSKV